MAIITRTFNGAQVFYVDPSTVDNTETCDISSVDLYFKFKPDFLLNSTGIKPSVSLFIAETMYGIPRVTRSSGIFTGEFATVPLEEILTSSDATIPTTFRFTTPVSIDTDKEYCFIFEYAMLGEFELWRSVQGEILTGTSSISPGPSDKFIGRYFGFNNVFTADDTTNLDQFLKNWRPQTDATLKFSVNLARYAHSGVPIQANGTIDTDDIFRSNPSAVVTSNSSGINFNINYGSYEYISFDENTSNKSAFVGGQMVFQNTVYHPGGWAGSNSYIEMTTVASNTIVTANSQYPNGSVFQWSSLFTTSNPENSMVLTDGVNYNVRNVGTIRSNTVIELTEPVTFSNTATKLMITPTGRVSSFNKSSPFGIDSAFMMIGNSSANSTVRFVNNSITSIVISAGGSGYANGDALYIKGYEDVANKVSGGYVAAANLVTNSTGGITAVHFSNLGCGFVNTATIVATVANSTEIGNTTSNSSAGTSATFTYTTGSNIKTEYGNSNFVSCEVRNLDIGEFIPFHEVRVPSGVPYTMKLETNYIKKSDTTTLAGEAFYVNDGVSNNQLDIVLYDRNLTESSLETPAIPSKSNEFNLLYEDTSVNDKIGSAAGRNSSVLRVINDVVTNDFTTFRSNQPSIQFSKYIINNDATDEHTDSGNAYAKGMTKTFDFKRTAEDVRLYITAYKPANTDIKVYTRLHKNEDPEAFDDKNWTELELKDGVGLYSSQADPLDYVELEYGPYQVPQTRTALTGAITIATGDATVVGANTLFQTDLAVGDLVYMYQPLFVENHLIASVESIASNTSFEMDTTTANSSLLAEGMKIEKVTYPMQGFNNIQNDGIVRYYNSSFSKFDGYESIAVKIVFLSDSPHRIPRVDDLQGLGISA